MVGRGVEETVHVMRQEAERAVLTVPLEIVGPSDLGTPSCKSPPYRSTG
jgi:hypothetical protein